MKNDTPFRQKSKTFIDILEKTDKNKNHLNGVHLNKQFKIFYIMKNPSISANDYYNQFFGTENYYSYLLGLILTDGVKTIADEENCYWFLDCIASYQLEEKFKKQEFQVWKIERIEDTKFKLSVTNGNNKVLATQEIPYSDFFFSEFTIWKEGNILLLPSEH